MMVGAAVDWFRPDEQEFKLGLSIVACLLIMAQIWRMLDMRPTSAPDINQMTNETYFRPMRPTSAEMRLTSAPDINQQHTHL
jgi:hypothetical protein